MERRKKGGVIIKRLTYRDKEGHARWRKELLEDETGAAGELIRNTVAEYEDFIFREEGNKED